MTYLLDTNVCVEHLRKRGRSLLSQKLIAIDPSEIAVCSVVRAELMAGANHSKAHKNELRRVTDLLALFKSLPFDDAAADHYGRVRAHVESIGMPIGSNDLMIASIALAAGLILVTHNGSEFSRVSGLVFQDWQQP